MDKRKKMIAPIIITVLVVLYYILFFAVIIWVVRTVWAVLLGFIPLILAGVMVYECLQRIKEIRSGEEDDLSDY